MALQKITRKDLIKIDDYLYEIPASFRSDMGVAARVFANEDILKDIFEDKSLWQLCNVATLPGIIGHAFAMPDIHQGYGFPIGGVAATAIKDGGVISPGGIGYDINCGVRLLAAPIHYNDIKSYLPKLATEFFKAVPSGVGRGGNIVLHHKDLDRVLQKGAHYMLEQGYGAERDLIYCEEEGMMSGADAALVSKKAKERGKDQIGTLGSGNHFLEIQMVDSVFDKKSADVLGLQEGFVTVMIHCGSRGLGHQVCTDYVQNMMPKLESWGIILPDRELVCAPFTSNEGSEYFAAMQAAANFAWANRHTIAHSVRQAWHSVLGSSINLNLVYDISHNIGKVEKHIFNNTQIDVVMHRKGATRAFGPGRKEIPATYRHIGQPVLIPGTMGTASYVLVGTAENSAFGSSCHGAGRKLSRIQAKKNIRGSTLRKSLEEKGIIIRSDSDPGLAEEAPEAYKNIEDVIQVIDGSALAKKVVRLKPLAVIKGG